MNIENEKGLNFLKRLDEIAGKTRNYIIKSEAETDPKYGFHPLERPIDVYIDYGFIPLDKPPGPTSHEIVAWIKKMFNISKAGHGGTLGPKPI